MSLTVIIRDRVELCFKKWQWMGHLAGSVTRACDSWYGGCKFKPHTARGAYLKKKKWIA